MRLFLIIVVFTFLSLRVLAQDVSAQCDSVMTSSIPWSAKGASCRPRLTIYPFGGCREMMHPIIFAGIEEKVKKSRLIV